MTELKETIAKNLTKLRLKNKYTQSEIAEKLNYTDKSVSKWEHGDATPPIDILKELADLYEVSLDYLVTDNNDKSYDKVYTDKKNTPNKIIITLLATSIVWIVATLLYFYLSIFSEHGKQWVVFIYAVPLSSIVLIVFNGIWGKRAFIFPLVSVLIWSFLTSVYLTFLTKTLWPIFIIGAPLQVAVILWAFLKPKNVKK